MLNMDWISLVVSLAAMLTAVAISHGVIRKTIEVHEKTLERIELKLEEMMTKSSCIALRTSCSEELRGGQSDMHCLLSKQTDVMNEVLRKITSIEARLEPLWEDWKNS